jgi:hypothetical protein
VKRREFITLLGGAAAWPLAAGAQQQPAMPVVGFLHPSSPEPYRVRAFRQGLKDAGFIEGENVAIEYRWAYDQIDRLSAPATELVQRRARARRAISGKRPVHACPLRVKSRTPAASRRTSIRKPSCLISCSQPAPAGGFAARLGRQGSQKSGKVRRRHNMPANETYIGESRVEFLSPLWQY